MINSKGSGASNPKSDVTSPKTYMYGETSLRSKVLTLVLKVFAWLWDEASEGLGIPA